MAMGMGWRGRGMGVAPGRDDEEYWCRNSAQKGEEEMARVEIGKKCVGL